MFFPEITSPPSACRAIPPTPRRLGTTVSMEPSGRRRYTPPLVTSLKYRFPAPSTRGPSINPYPYASVSNRMLFVSIFPPHLPRRDAGAARSARATREPADGVLRGPWPGHGPEVAARDRTAVGV